MCWDLRLSNWILGGWCETSHVSYGYSYLLTAGFESQADGLEDMSSADRS